MKKCKDCGKTIPEERVKALGIAKRCVKCQDAFDKTKEKDMKGWLIVPTIEAFNSIVH